MKPLFLFIFFCLLGLNSSAQQASYSSLQLRLSNNKNIAIDIDGKFINRQTTSLTLDGLNSGTHKITVYAVNERGNRMKRIYTGHLRFSGSTRYEGFVDTRNRILNLAAHPLQSPTPLENNENGPTNTPLQQPTNQATTPPQEPTSQNDDDMPAVGSFPQGRGNVGQAHMDFSGAKMQQLKQTVTQKQTDTEKLKLLKNAVEGEDIYTAQVKEMLSWLDFESSRLDFAQWAYSYVRDSGNYAKLAEQFHQKSNKQAFLKSIDR